MEPELDLRVAPRIVRLRPSADPGALVLLGYAETDGGAVATSEILRVDMTVRPSALYRASGLTLNREEPQLVARVAAAIAKAKPTNAGLWKKCTRPILFRIYPDTNSAGEIAISAYRVHTYGMDAMKHMGEDMADIYEDICRRYSGKWPQRVLYNLMYELSTQDSEAGVASLLKEAGSIAKDIKAAFKRAGQGTSAKAIYNYIKQSKAQS